MAKRVAVCLLFLTLSARAADPTEAPGLAELYGYTLGAASACPAVPARRLDQAAALAAEHLKVVAGSDKAANEAAAHLVAGIDRGKRDIASGLLTCDQAESELANLEHDLSP